MLSFKGFFLKYKWETLGAFLLLFVVLVNRFPSGYVFLGGDVLQAIRMTENFAYYHYEWFGRASLFYGIFYLLDTLRVSDAAQLSWYLGIFLFGAYFSFLGFCTLVFPIASKLTRTLSAIFYATNVYTLYVFTASWGYSHYQIIYIFIPILTGLYIQSLKTKNNLFFFLFFLAVFFASTSFGNPAFALALAVYFFFLTAFLFLFRFLPFERKIPGKVILLLFGALLLNAYWILPLLPQMTAGIARVYSTEFVNLSERLRETSNAVFDTVRLLPTSEQKRYFPANFPYPSFDFLKKGIILLTFVPFFLILLGHFQKRNILERKFYGIFFALFIIFIALVARVRFPFDTVNGFLFQLPGLNVLRSWDKLATFVPFLLSALLVMFFMAEQKKSYFKFLALFFFSLTVVLSLPFYAGGVQTKLSYILDTQKAKDFEKAKLSALVKIPEDYYKVMPIFMADQGEYKIAMLPFSPGSSIGRVSLPAWKVNGPDAAQVLYSKTYVELYDYYIPGWMFAQDFKNTQYDPQWIVDLYGLIGVKYIFYHKDAKADSIEKMEEARKYLESIGALKKIDDNQSFILYQIDRNRIFPYVYVTDEQAVLVKPSPVGLSEKVQGFHREISALIYQRQNPKKTVVAVDRLMDQSHIFLNERYDPLWRAEHVSRDGKRILLERDENVKYANAWKVGDTLSGGSIEIYYFSLRLFSIGQWISGIALLLVIVGTASALRKKNNS